jgi:ABC-type glycerol-3-phosphate transport system substrate-binding protein
MLKKAISRRRFLKMAGAVTAAAAMNPQFSAFAKPHRQLSGELKILQWSHFVPRYDEWFDPFAAAWGDEVGVNVTVDHIGLADIPSRTAAEIAAGEGHDLIEWLAPPAAYEPSVLDLSDVFEEATNRFGEQIALATRSSFNPTTEKYYGFCHGWVPDPGDYRKSLWEEIGMPNGPSTWDELLEGGAEIKDSLGVQMGIGMSNEIDSNMAARALLWSFGASVQDENENVVINSPEAVAAVAFMKELYERTMTPEVFSWAAASNNQLLIAGQASYILNSISAYRTAQGVNPEVADDVFFLPALPGPSGVGLASEHVIPIYIIPEHAENPDAAKEFILHLLANYEDATMASELYTFPAFFDTMPGLLDDGGPLDDDPFGSNPSDKLSVLKSAPEWSTVIGHPGPANPAIGEVYGTFILPNMMAKSARGEASPEEAVADAEQEILEIFEKWRNEGLIGGGSA